jgi:site-specific DNA-adenine methylase
MGDDGRAPVHTTRQRRGGLGARVQSVAPWLGSDGGMVEQIVRELGQSHRTFWQLFAGGCGVLLNKPRVSNECAVDLHASLVNLLLALADPPTFRWLRDRLRVTMYADHVRERAHATRLRCEALHESGGLEMPSAEWAAAAFVEWWTGKGGEAGGVEQGGPARCAIRYTEGGGHMGGRYAAACDALDAFADRLRGVMFYHRDVFDVLARIADEPTVAIYADPPFIEGGELYRHSMATRAGHDGLSLLGEHDDHDRLAEALGRFTRARVVLRYYGHPRLAGLYPAGRWRRVSCRRTKHSANTSSRGGRGDTSAPDLLLVNDGGAS